MSNWNTRLLVNMMCVQRIISCKCFTVTEFSSIHSSIGVMRIKKKMYMSASRLSSLLQRNNVFFYFLVMWNCMSTEIDIFRGRQMYHSARIIIIRFRTYTSLFYYYFNEDKWMCFLDRVKFKLSNNYKNCAKPIGNCFLS